jgi:hypothetical protein
MEKIKQYKYIIMLALVIFIGVFYWYELRPAIVKHNCSWVKRHAEAIPAKLSMTKEDIKKADECDNQLDDNTNNTPALSKLKCLSLRWEPQSAQPARDWWEEATPVEYQFCLHNHGL